MSQRFVVPFRPLSTALSLVSQDYPALRAAGGVLECVQESGDVLFVPEAWGHATLNLAESIGAASEFEWGMSEFAIDPPPEPEEVAGADEDEADSALLDGAAAGEMGGGSDADEDKVYTAMPM